MARHILIINHEFPPTGGGAATASAHLAREMVALGARVTVVTSTFGGLPRHERRDGADIVRIPALRRRADKSNILEFCSFLISSLGWAMLCRGRGPRPDAIRFNACIAFFGLPAGPAAYLLRLFHGVPYVVSLRGGDVPGFLPQQLAAWHRCTGGLIRALWRRAAHVVGNSAGLTALARRAAPDVDVATIPNGVDAACFRPLPDAGSDEADSAEERDFYAETPPEACRLLFTGRLNGQKNLPCLLQALVPLRGHDWTLTLVGDGPDREQLECLAHGLGLAERVRFTGWVERARLPGVLRRADMYVFPSIQEGMPNTVLEAMACGLPVVACRIEGCAELVRDGKTGFLVPPDDAPALTEAIERLLYSAGLRTALGAHGRRVVEQEYTWRATAERYLALCGGAR